MGLRPLTAKSQCPHCGLRFVPTLRPVVLISEPIGLVLPSTSEGIVAWECPRCRVRWHHWDKTSPLAAAAEELINPVGWNELTEG